MITRPASLKAVVRWLSRWVVRPTARRLPSSVCLPASGAPMSLRKNGTPASGGGAVPSARAWARTASRVAARSAASSYSSTMALRPGSTRAAASTAAAVSSAAVTSPAATRAANSVADRPVYSPTFTAVPPSPGNF